MNIDVDEKKQELSNQILEKKEPSNCNKRINKFIKFPTLTYEKLIRIVFLVGGTVFMLINCYTGMLISRFFPQCLDDMTHITTSKINDFFLRNSVFNIILKFVFSFIIDLLIIYTLIVWSLYGTNVRLLSSGISYMILNVLVRFIHIQKQPEKSAFTMNHIFSFFINYNISTYSFYSVFAGLIIICAFEWKRDNNQIMFWIFIVIFILECFIVIIMQGNYFHELFTGGFAGHYLFMMNEKVLEFIFGKEYLKMTTDEDDNNSEQTKTSSSLEIKMNEIGSLNSETEDNVNETKDNDSDKEIKDNANE